MLIGIKIGNYKSYNNIEHFSLVAGKTRSFPEHIEEINNIKILKFSALYGANASGKSNFADAIGMCKDIIRNGIDFIFSNQYFRIDKLSKDKPSYFEFELALNNKLYSYGFEISINKKEIISEWLIDMTKPKEKIIFERDAINCTINSSLNIKNKDDKNSFNVCIKDIKNNNKILFLTELVRRINMNNNTTSFQDFTDVYNFFENDLQLILPNQDKEIQVNYFSEYSEEIKNLLQQLGLDIDKLMEVDSSIEKLKEKLGPKKSDWLMHAIQDVKSKMTNFEMSLRVDNGIYFINGNNKSDELKIRVLKIVHNSSEELFDTYEESDGTLRILELLDVLLSNNKVYVIDEIDRSLHPSLTLKFIKTFLDIAKTKNIQLIITTHETRLLDYDIVRRDEIWFCEKNENGETRLYSLEQFKDDARFDRKIDKAYLDGRYGAIPIFRDYLEKSINETDK